MLRSVRLSELEGLTPEERKNRLVHVARGGGEKANGEIVDLRAQVAAFESKYGFTTEQLKTQLSAGTTRENYDVARWLFCIEKLNVLGGA